MATFTFDGTTSQTTTFNVALDRVIFDLNAEDLVSISEDRSANTVTIVATSGAVLTLTNTNLAAIRAGEAGGMNNFIAGVDSDILFDIGTRGNDTALVGNVVVGLEGTDTITGASNDGTAGATVARPGALLFGNVGADVITNGTQFSARMYGGQGNDRLVLATANGSDASLLVGGLGTDFISVGSSITTGTSGGTLASSGAYNGSVTVFGGNEAGDPTDGTDNITAQLGASGDALIFGNGGDDVITVTATTTATGASATAAATGVVGGMATILGGQGNDVITAALDGGSIVGGLGNDAIVLTSVGTPGNDFTVTGGNGMGDAADGADTITMTLQNNDSALVFGNGGNDRVTLLGTADSEVTIFGGQGNDTIGGSATGAVTAATVGDDSLIYGGLGNDVINIDVVTQSMASVGSRVTVYGGNGSADAADGADLITVDLDGNVRGVGSTGAMAEQATIFGNGGDDSIVLLGEGAATVFGGAGNDTITAGEGLYTVFGGAGADRFVFDSTAGVTGVNQGVDVTNTTVSADVSLISDLNFDQDELDLGVNVTQVFDITNSGNFVSATLSGAATSAFNQATAGQGNGAEAAVLFTYQGEEFLVQAVSANTGTGATGIDETDIATLIRVTGFTGTADANDFVA